jgi:recombination protein RecA
VASSSSKNTNPPSPANERAQAIDAAVASIERMFGKGSIMKYGAADVVPVSTISTGTLGLDLALGIGGVPKGRVIEIFGAESSGKTTLALQVIAQAQKQGGVAAFIDAEHALDVNYARNLGVQLDELLISQPDTGEQALEITETLVRSGAISVVVVDSVAALVPRAELEGDMGDSQPGAQARLMSQALRKLTGAIHKSECVVVFINQLREKIGVMFGSPKTTSGGNALRFYASVRIEIARIGSIKKGEEVLGNRTKAKVVKNKLAPPFRQVEFDIYYGLGTDLESELIDLGLATGIVKKSGSWFSVEGERAGQGKDNARDWLKENRGHAERVKAHILQHHGVAFESMKATGEVEAEDAADPALELPN